MAALSIAEWFDRTRLGSRRGLADGRRRGLAALVYVGDGILWVLRSLALIRRSNGPTCGATGTSAGGLPVLLFLLGALGMAWGDVTLLQRWEGSFIFQAAGHPAAGDAVSPLGQWDAGFHRVPDRVCGVVIASWASAIWPDLPRARKMWACR